MGRENSQFPPTEEHRWPPPRAGPQRAGRLNAMRHAAVSIQFGRAIEYFQASRQ